MLEALGDLREDDTLLEARGLTKAFLVKSGILGRTTGELRAVDGIDLAIRKGETLGLVGESGCGKTTLGRTLLRLFEPSAGSIRFEGKDITHLPQEPMRRLRREMQMIFQDPYSSLNPRMRVGPMIEEGMIVHGLGDRKERKSRVAELLEVVGLRPDAARKYPHEFSGGQRQRIGIARALALLPKLVIADEPVSALDVSIQAQILNLMMELQASYGLTYLLISHDLRVVEHMSDRVCVMYLGRIVEIAPSASLYTNPCHPYTQALLAAVPVPDPNRKASPDDVRGDVPSRLAPPPGCSFHPRCPHSMDVCVRKVPLLQEVRPDHFVACHLYTKSDN
jgi:oligopeptide/dipeptide ABC transporter ATP-binding protein